MRARLLLVVALLATALLAGCGKDDSTPNEPIAGAGGDSKQAAQALGFPSFATKNTTRIGGSDAIADAAAVARAVYPAATAETRPDAVTLVDDRDWRSAVAAAVLMSRPVRAPVLFAHGTSLPPATEAALEALGPRGSRSLEGAQVVRIGDVAKPSGLKARNLAGGDPFTVANELDRVVAATRGAPSDDVVIASADAPAFAMPAAGWAVPGQVIGSDRSVSGRV